MSPDVVLHVAHFNREIVQFWLELVFLSQCPLKKIGFHFQTMKAYFATPFHMPDYSLVTKIRLVLEVLHNCKLHYAHN